MPPVAWLMHYVPPTCHHPPPPRCASNTSDLRAAERDARCSPRCGCPLAAAHQRHSRPPSPIRSGISSRQPKPTAISPWHHDTWPRAAAASAASCVLVPRGSSISPEHTPMVCELTDGAARGQGHSHGGGLVHVAVEPQCLGALAAGGVPPREAAVR